ncbi:MAG: hypothetical protein C4B58_05805 [Deltaproteobacteria bacterium]|nr:MAG: hypothetical protein C4B58_05805 [Deltaproteobacteria bacterium]
MFWQVHKKLFKFSLLSNAIDRSMILLAETMIMAEISDRIISIIDNQYYRKYGILHDKSKVVYTLLILCFGSEIKKQN